MDVPPRNPEHAFSVWAARVAGICYVVIIGLGVFQATFIAAHAPASGDSAATVTMLAEQALLLRLGIVSDVLLYVLVLVLAVALYLLLRHVHQPLALGALVLRSAEGIVGLSVTILGGLVPLALLPAGVDSGMLDAFVSLRDSGLQIVLVLVGFGGATFCYLFLRSSLVPSGLAVWGIVTYLSMIVLGAWRILWPDPTAPFTNILYYQGGLFEVTLGLWLLVKTMGVSADGGGHR